VIQVFGDRKMRCDCPTLPDLFYLDEAPQGFRDSLHGEEAQNWMSLFCCPVCGTLWAIDNPDKFYDQVIARVIDRDSWENNNNSEGRKQLLLKSRGGTTEEECSWAGCKDKCIKGVAFCLEHLWKTGARR